MHWTATVCGPQGVHELDWQSPVGAQPFIPGQLIRTGTRTCRRFGVSDALLTSDCDVTPMWDVDPDVNLIDTVPASWLPETTSSVKRFRLLWELLPADLRAWFNALFWSEPLRLHAFLTAPASMRHHHARKHGLFEHSVDCAWRARESARGDVCTSVDVLVLAALLHDAGKAGEYGWNAECSRWELTVRGELVGHRLTVQEWMAVARARLPRDMELSESTAMMVYHAIQACHAPDWVGLRAPRTPEAHHMASVDALSGHCDLIHVQALKGPLSLGNTASLPRALTARYVPALRRTVYLGRG